MVVNIYEAMEGCLGIQGYWPKTDTGYFCKHLKGYGIHGSILGIWGYIIQCFLHFVDIYHII